MIWPEAQWSQVRPLLEPFQVARVVLGGGTPTHLSLVQLESLLEWLPRGPFMGVETSPATAQPARLELLRKAGFTRISMGVQTFVPAETEAVHRWQPEELFVYPLSVRPQTRLHPLSPGWERALRPRACETDTCRCHIGYVHLDYLELAKVYGSGILERIPSQTATSS